MNFYLVGGAVRDMQMGIKPKDFDFVVVGATPDDFKTWECVGNDFPVFLSPMHKWEVALARVERKIGVGYTGFESSWEGVTLEEDLSRRDLTINSMAIEVDWVETVKHGEPVIIGELIDPFNGLEDLRNGIIHPTTEAFEEDPIRLLRAGRFLSRYEGFKPSVQLEMMCKRMEQNGELDHLVPERIWLETEKALKESQPEKYFEFIKNFKFPFTNFLIELEKTVEGNSYHQEANVFVHTMMVLEHASKNWKDQEINFACLMHDIAKPQCYKAKGNGHGHDKEGVELVQAFCKEFKVPSRFRELAVMTCEQHQKIHSVLGRDENEMSRPKSIMKIFEMTAALTKPERFRKMLKACESDAKGRIGLAANVNYIQRRYMEECLEAVLNVETKPISSKLLEEGKSGLLIGEAIRVARIAAIRKVQREYKK